jgi:hypothetical protein
LKKELNGDISIAQGYIPSELLADKYQLSSVDPEDECKAKT